MNQKKLEANVESILESVNFIKDHMADEMRDVIHEEVPEILRKEIKDIREQLKALAEASEAHEGHAGFAKEIDHVLQRVVEIEKHLGIKSPARQSR
ncbi:hypothetical protein A3C21_00420 [Candidatus Kaiserbacteria bacterium RIFCSPHIGHO2_02_FULL_59_21]|uniref:Uncharacterized protein n=1 Tax=Candidatus Kaiserbacteria bacterium RIFCSPHIGHO2_02_FULL_59_21 TaxID=1798500 RepID=A0A1F6DYS6_9BACT|nr:MAG: hypothetical protein A2766_00190 [Candidatus Kaiserbacteria bacterium RIFCSPHIGHO2_01_FULL_58_22]OGG66571.1 MAG: hypothetical protein A3C21_00420 [Candidatus Kaiserbacteria bacterium RIFCSPHIGHO2_02_FULL_59_21]OGG86365.1 MAG: hypothetical protein A3I47_01100 [Candidatus Kaiserbacteria bacterium RIFCSPLOWO2_02_FULL_59_19]